MNRPTVTPVANGYVEGPMFTVWAVSNGFMVTSHRPGGESMQWSVARSFDELFAAVRALAEWAAEEAGATLDPPRRDVQAAAQTVVMARRGLPRRLRGERAALLESALEELAAALAGVERNGRP